MRTPLVTAVSVLFYLDALLWLLGVGLTLRYAFVHRSLPVIAGVRALSGPFESLGMDAFVVAGMLYLVVSALKIMAGFWLWNTRLDGAVLGLILVGLSAIFWYGFELPIGPIIGIAQVILLALAWSALA